jgi:hypothetical protein
MNRVSGQAIGNEGVRWGGLAIYAAQPRGFWGPAGGEATPDRALRRRVANRATPPRMNYRVEVHAASVSAVWQHEAAHEALMVIRSSSFSPHDGAPLRL